MVLDQLPFVVQIVSLSAQQTRLEELHRLWDLLLQKTKEKGVHLLQAQKLVQYLRECEDALDWISDKVSVSTCSHTHTRTHARAREQNPFQPKHCNLQDR